MRGAPRFPCFLDTVYVFLVLVVGGETLSMVRFLSSGGSHDTCATVSLFLSMSVLLLTREGPAFGRGRPEQGAWQLWRCTTVSLFLSCSLVLVVSGAALLMTIVVRIGSLASQSGGPICLYYLGDLTMCVLPFRASVIRCPCYFL